jgi:hypothetical protein
MTAREPNGRDADYLQWHSLDHRPEQYRVQGLRHSIRLVSTPACQAARTYSAPPYDSVAHVMTYYFTENAAFDQFRVLSAALAGDRRPFRLPTINANYYTLAGKIAAPRAIAGADVIPWRAAQGIYLLVEKGSVSPAPLVNVPGVAGIWWHRGGPPIATGFSDNTEMQITYCFIDDDLLLTAAKLGEALTQRWKTADMVPLLAAPFFTLVPFDWDRYLP